MWTSLSLAALALGLAMDAFAVAVAQGASGRADMPTALRVGGAFGLAQGIMPLLGWALGTAFVSIIRGVDHWLALLLLGYLGWRMLRQAFSQDQLAASQLVGWALATAAFATSVDALAAGVTLPSFEVPVLIACVAIAVTTAILCVGGVLGGAAAGTRIGKWADIAGGLILVALGLKIFIEHQFFGA